MIARWLVALLFLLSLATAVTTTAVEKGDFTIQVRRAVQDVGVSVRSITPEIFLSNGKHVFDAKVQFTPPEGISTNENLTKSVYFIDDRPVAVPWKATAEVEKEYDFTDSFEVVSWDDSVELEMTAIPSTIGNRTFKITGKTDDVSFCRFHQFRGKYSLDENCKTKVSINNEEAFFANDEGFFSKEVEFEEGDNFFSITVTDPGDNTNSQEVKIVYDPSLFTKFQDNMAFVVIGIVSVVMIIILIVLLIMRRSRKVEQKVETVKMDIETDLEKKEIEKEEQSKKQRLQFLKDRRKQIRAELIELTKRKAVGGATPEDITRMKAYDQELISMQDELLKSPEFQQELKRVADEVYEARMKGVSSQDIMQALKADYSDKEIEIVKRSFKDRTTQAQP